MNKIVIDYRENNAKQKLKEVLNKWIESIVEEYFLDKNILDEEGYASCREKKG